MKNSILRTFLLGLVASIMVQAGSADEASATEEKEEEEEEEEEPSFSTTDVDLPFGDINVVVLTDVHSWVGGHGAKEPTFDADYGDVLSFYQLLQAHCLAAGMDLWLVVNGDWIDGTGLAIDGDASYLIPILQKMPFDAVNIGNHELYRSDVIQYMTRPGGFVDWWGNGYLSSNVRHSDTKHPLGSPFLLLKGRNSNVLVFGFLYNMQDHADAVIVDDVEEIMQQDWFQQALISSNYDAIVVLAHMDVEDNLVKVILTQIRSQVGHGVPVQFITGHTHYRGFATLDDASVSFEAGRYLDTVGFVSFPTKETAAAVNKTASNITDLFQHKFIDASVATLQGILRQDNMETEDGKALSEFIHVTRQRLGLDAVVGCVPQSYMLNRTLFQEDSLWRLFREQVVPSQFHDDDVVFLNKGSWRYDLLHGDITLDEVYGVSPFDSTMFLWPEVTLGAILALNESMNRNPEPFMPLLPEYILASLEQLDNNDTSSNVTFNLISDSFEAGRIEEELAKIYSSPNELPLVVHLNITTTSIWLAFFEENQLCSKNPLPMGSNPKHDSHSGHQPFVNSTGNAASDPRALDADRLWFVFLACIVLAVVGVYNVKQRSRLYNERVAAREHATMQALRDYEADQRQFI